MLKWLGKFLGDTNDKELRKQRPIIAEINALEPEYERLSDEGLRDLTVEFKEKLAAGQNLDDILPEAFAAVREAAKRTIKQRHFDTQLMGGIVLHQGKIAEMKTGEGKTLVATLPTYLNALTGKGVHLITVNDYLAKRDPQWMGPIYHLLGLSLASIQHESSYLYDPDFEADDPRYKFMRPISRYEAYRADITYGTNSEFGFDYLRDNMVVDLSQCSQRELNFAIVDEVDNILIDEARTPLIISGQAEEATDNYFQFSKLVTRLVREEDYKIDEKVRAVSLTEVGIGKMEKWLGLDNVYDPQNYGLTRYMENALKAEIIFKKDRDYVVKDGQVIIVDEFTGRLMFGRRYSEGLHQAIEAKEGMRIQRESVTLATVTLQNYFRMYKKLAGMTGTAATEAEEFHKIYKLDVVVMPTNKQMIRTDSPDQIFKTEEAKFKAVVREIESLYELGRPVLVGTVSIEKSEHLSWMLQQKGVAHQVLNAKYHEKEAAIIAEAGQAGAVTIATNMAGRGTDIVLGPGVTDKGGLHIIGTERHEARRIDNQLRGRAGRQGDPGSSRFYVSLEDEIMKRFGGDRIKGFMEWAGLEDDVPIEHAIVSRSLESAQIKVEGYNFDIRKHLVDYDDVINKHRDVIYTERKKILSGADLKGNILDMVLAFVGTTVNAYLVDEHGDEWDTAGLVEALSRVMPVPPDMNANAIAQMAKEEARERLIELAESLYESKEKEIGESDMRMLERLVMLRIIDNLWIEHLTGMDDMREGISLRAVGQNDPLVAYKREAHSMFESLLNSIQRDIVNTIYNVSISRAPVPPPIKPLRTNRDDAVAPIAGRRSSSGKAGLPNNKKVGRNDPCPCGSGRKYKKCHGTAA